MRRERLRVAVTGARGFIGSNLVLRLTERGHDVLPITRDSDLADATRSIAAADTIFHVAGVNRPADESEFRSNADHASWLADLITRNEHGPLVVFSSSIKAAEDTPYGTSKRAAEDILLALAAEGKATVSIWRLPNVYGKWSRPNYNSVVATFCHNIARGLPLQIDDPTAPLSLLYVDDLIDQWLRLIGDPPQTSGLAQPQGTDLTTVGELAELLQQFSDLRSSGEVEDVAFGLKRRLFASFMSALPIEDVAYSLAPRTDPRGSFVEILKTGASGQFSYFTAHPGMTCGGHYHHSKVEKFVVASGTGRFRFRHAISGETFEIVSNSTQPTLIETLPGWAHDVTNVGDNELIVISWASEQFDPERPDTHAMPLAR